MPNNGVNGVKHKLQDVLGQKKAVDTISLASKSTFDTILHSNLNIWSTPLSQVTSLMTELMFS